MLLWSHGEASPLAPKLVWSMAERPLVEGPPGASERESA